MTTEISGCTYGLEIGVQREARGPLPCVRGGARKAARPQVMTKRLVVDDADDRVAPGGDVAWVEQHPGAAEHFGNRGGVRREHRRTARHRLNERQPESFVERRI